MTALTALTAMQKELISNTKDLLKTGIQTWANGSTSARPSKSIYDSPFIRVRIPMQIAVNDSDLL